MFGAEKPIIGMVHLPPLPSSPRYDGRDVHDIVERALQDAKALKAGGIDGLTIENFGDAPYLKANVGPETVSAMASIAKEVVDAVDVPVGINVLRNDAKAALAIANAAGGEFIRVNVFTEAIVSDQGIIEACAPELIRYRRRLGAEGIKIFADVHVKHGALLSARPIEESAKDAAYRGFADALIITGARTGEAPELQSLLKVKKAVPEKPVLIGSGTTRQNVAKLLEHADGAIVGTSFKAGGIVENPVDGARVMAFMAEVKKLRQLQRR
ncbi:MAG: BtpA/SgcQ family protein [Candidatus Hodarchaeaceae archaeon]|nr:BtpA/SgcQ family protein [Candidatus Hodarchaeaceae archaeon]